MWRGCAATQSTRSVRKGHSREELPYFYGRPFTEEWFRPAPSLASAHDLRTAQDPDGQLLRRRRELDVLDIA